jgi:MtN3 and saliva related transmembrane protein
VKSDLTSLVGVAAAFLASLSYFPQVLKAWPRESTADLSLGMLCVLTVGLGLWIVYGVLRGDWIIISANAIGTALAAIVLIFKIRDLIAFSSQDHHELICEDQKSEASPPRIHSPKNLIERPENKASFKNKG